VRSISLEWKLQPLHCFMFLPHTLSCTYNMYSMLNSTRTDLYTLHTFKIYRGVVQRYHCHNGNVMCACGALVHSCCMTVLSLCLLSNQANHIADSCAHKCFERHLHSWSFDNFSGSPTVLHTLDMCAHRICGAYVSYTDSFHCTCCL
jgi:hypothetical protein